MVWRCFDLKPICCYCTGLIEGYHTLVPNLRFSAFETFEINRWMNNNFEKQFENISRFITSLSRTFLRLKHNSFSNERFGHFLVKWNNIQLLNIGCFISPYAQVHWKITIWLKQTSCLVERLVEGPTEKYDS